MLILRHKISVMSAIIKKIFLNEKVILIFIIINTSLIFIQESGYNSFALSCLDIIFTVFFSIEIIVKIKEFSFKSFWSSGWNRMDFILVAFSLPSAVIFITGYSISDISVLLAIRMLRLLRIFRIYHFFPNINQITKGFLRALKQSRAILLSFAIIIVITGLLNCALYKNIVPEYFATPFDSIYTIFRLFTTEGWYEIPDAISASTSPFWGNLSRIYFCIILCAGGIIGLSFINSVFVDAMVEDNNDDVKDKLKDIEKQLDELKEILKDKS